MGSGSGSGSGSKSGSSSGSKSSSGSGSKSGSGSGSKSSSGSKSGSSSSSEDGPDREMMDCLQIMYCSTEMTTVSTGTDAAGSGLSDGVNTHVVVSAIWMVVATYLMM